MSINVDEKRLTLADHWFLMMVDTKGPWLIPEMSGYDKTNPLLQNYWHLGKARKGYLRKCNHHKVNEPCGGTQLTGRGSQVDIYCQHLEQVLFVNAWKIAGRSNAVTATGAVGEHSERQRNSAFYGLMLNDLPRLF